MKFDFFTLGGRFFWEDIYNYRNWIIQRKVNKQHYRLLDPYMICRDSGSFEQCKNTLLKYIEACELEPLYEDTILILHGFGRTRNSVTAIANFLKDLPANVICVNYASLRAGINFHALMLEQFIRNLDTKGYLFIINVGAASLLTRKLISNTDDYRAYKIARIIDINPLNSGSDFVELFSNRKLAHKLFGQMLQDIETRKAISLPKLPSEIDHGIIFCYSLLHRFIRKFIAHFDSFPFSTPPSEQSYAKKTKQIKETPLFPLKSRELFDNCRNFIIEGEFLQDDDDKD